jgi:hypothetical protein
MYFTVFFRNPPGTMMKLWLLRTYMSTRANVVRVSVQITTALSLFPHRPALLANPFRA